MSLAMLFEFIELMIDITFLYFRKPNKPNEELNQTENQTMTERNLQQEQLYGWAMPVAIYVIST